MLAAFETNTFVAGFKTNTFVAGHLRLHPSDGMGCRYFR